MIHELSTSVAALRHQHRLPSPAPQRGSSVPPTREEPIGSAIVPTSNDAPVSPTSASSSDETNSEPPERRAKRMRRSGGINLAHTWTPDMAAKIPWLAKFISGPKDPLSNPHSVFCHVCRVSISIRGKGHHNIIRHSLREKHLRKEQRYRDTHNMEVLDRKRNVLTGHRLEKERRLFEDAPDFEIGTRYPFYNAESSSAPETVDVAASQLKLQLRCLTDLIRNGQQIPSFQSVWRCIMPHLPESDVTTGLDFSEERIVCLVQFLFNCLVKTLRDVVGADGRYGIVFEEVLGERRAHLSFWMGDSLMTVALFSCDKLQGGENLDLLILSRLLAALTPSCCPVSCVGTRLDVIKTIDRYFQPKTGILAHSPVGQKLFEKLLTSPTNLVFGRVDILSVVEHVTMRLRGATSEEWLLRCPSLQQVSHYSVLCLNYLLVWRISFSTVSIHRFLYSIR